MDIYDYLKKDHEKVANLFKQFEKTESKQRKKEIFEMIAQELLVHSKSEEKTFYAILEQRLENKEPTIHAKKEHHEIEQQISLALHTKTLDKNWEKRVLKLKEVVEHHVEEEESNLFKKAKKVFSEEEAYALKEKMHYMKGELLNRTAKVQKVAKMKPIAKVN